MRIARHWGLRGSDEDELVQAVLVDVYDGRKSFVYDRSRGRFRDYLKKAMATRLGKQRRQAQRAGTPTERLEEPWEDGWEKQWEEEYRAHVLREALAQVRREVEPRTYQAFQLYALERIDANEVARFLGISVSGVYVYKRRILERLRAIVQELIDE
jgi:RNA polymerase sigma factor (sigma-70 family)